MPSRPYGRDDKGRILVYVKSAMNHWLPVETTGTL